jgi:polysaccharide export outer membrane protein
MTKKPLKTFLATLTIVALVASDLTLGATVVWGQVPGGYGAIGQSQPIPGGGMPSFGSPSPLPSLPAPQLDSGRITPAPPTMTGPRALTSSTCPANGGYRLDAFRQPQTNAAPPFMSQSPVTQVSAQGGGNQGQGVQGNQAFAGSQAQGNQAFAGSQAQPTQGPQAGGNNTQAFTRGGQPSAPAPGNNSQPFTPIVTPDYEDLSKIEAGFNSDLQRLLTPPDQSANVDPATVLATTLATPFRQWVDSTSTPAELATPIRQYGYTMFASNVTTFAPVDDMPVGPDYVVGPGDDLNINVWGPVDTSLVRTVDRNGSIVLPKVGDLRVWGMTFSEADRLIREQLARYFRGFQTSVTMGRLRTVRVYVVGEVCQPGVYTFSSLSTVTNALYGAGGPTKLGSLRNVRLLRNHHVVGTLDLYDFLQRGDRTRDFRLESGDTIFVPTIGDVTTVAGEVKRPAVYELRGDVRLADVIEMAGGVTPGSYLRRVQVVRTQPSAERVTLDVDMSRYYLRGDDAGNPPVQGGDLVLIRRSDPRIYNTVKVDGAVKYPGLYELKPLMRISDLLGPEKVLPEAQTERVEVARRRADFSVEILSVNLRKAWAGDQEQDVALKPLDEVSVRTEFRDARMVSITGQVLRPGRYPIMDGERISSVVQRAGGFTDKAFLKGAVFTRAALRKTEQDQLQAFVQLQQQAIMGTASTTIVGAEKEEIASQQVALQARRDMLTALASRVAVGRMVIRLDDPTRLRGTPNDIVLVEGDTLDVPEPPSSVLVIGSVRSSTSVLYQPNANVDYYVNRVGGYSKEADKKEVLVVKADGSGLAGFANIRDIEPGDTVMVPPKQEEKIRVLPTVRDVMQILGSTLLSFAALALLF